MAMGKDAKDIAKYIASGYKGKAPASYVACSGCHGTKGEGVPYAGPKIDGYDIANIIASGKKGFIGKMPAFKTLITPIQEKALTVYLQSIIK
ncbi:Cytochrome c oxidase subunit CcoP [hydrothermal vent metagenome]|uniref:Cytochrome c oxidase subunit CcoP n=1 Tax=hydrothermal vent metagenome TaxID=652676 RepID=A0A1W1CHK7_9ZZZZ